MNTIKTHIPDIVIFEPDVYGDDRGFLWISTAGNGLQN